MGNCFGRPSTQSSGNGAFAGPGRTLGGAHPTDHATSAAAAAATTQKFPQSAAAPAAIPVVSGLTQAESDARKAAALAAEVRSAILLQSCYLPSRLFSSLEDTARDGPLNLRILHQTESILLDCFAYPQSTIMIFPVMTSPHASLARLHP
jgi:hypothetical protein